MEYLGCCLVMRRYFWSGRTRVGKTACAASRADSIGPTDAPGTTCFIITSLVKDVTINDNYLMYFNIKVTKE